MVSNLISSVTPASRRRRLASIWLTLLANVFFLFLQGTELALADNDRAVLQTQLKKLLPIRRILLMAVPYGVAFAKALDEQHLPANSCVYQIDTEASSTADEILRILDESILEYRTDLPGRDRFEVRFGIVLIGNSAKEFYFQDWGGKHEVKGFSGSNRILASADFTTRLRALVIRPGVILTRDQYGSCPHS